MADAEDHDLLIRIEQRITSIDSCLKGMDEWQRSVEGRLRSVELLSAGNKIGVDSLKSDVISFKEKSNTLDIILGVIAVIGAIVGSILGISSP